MLGPPGADSQGNARASPPVRGPVLQVSPGALASAPGSKRYWGASPPRAARPPRAFVMPPQSPYSDPPVSERDQQLAAIDLGSNSFHLMLAIPEGGGLRVIDRLREPVRLAAGLDSEKHLSDEAAERALACLRRFGSRLEGFAPERVRAVGTNTLRAAKNARGFQRRAQDALGFPIEVLPGAEEARVVYLGVAHDLSDDAGRRMVVDIGGGSTELVVGERFELLEAHSLHMGCVSYTQRYFREGFSSRAFSRARLAAARELLPLRRSFIDLGFVDAVGSSGTIKSIANCLRAEGWSDGRITAEGLDRLERALVRCESPAGVDLAEISNDRAQVIAGGLSILRAVFDQLDLESMRKSDSALREGLLWDLLGRREHEDKRLESLRAFQERYGVDRAHAHAVRESMLALFDQVHPDWELDAEHDRLFAGFSADLHEVGLALSYSGYHKHGEYLIQHSDLAGFSTEDKLLLARLVRLHRRKIDRSLFQTDSGLRARRLMRLTVLLRIAVLLERARLDAAGARPANRPSARAAKGQLSLTFEAGVLDDNPLLAGDLEAERKLLGKLGFELVLS